MKRRPRGSIIISLAIHVVVGVIFVRALWRPMDLQRFLGFARPTKPVAEQVTYVAPRVQASGGVPSQRVQTRPVVAPTVVPTVIPDAPATGAVAVPPSGAGAAGAATGGGGGTGPIGLGIPTPGTINPALWVPPPPAGPVTKRGPQQKAQEDLAAAIRAHNDSIANAGPKRAPGDWTFDLGGKKFGMDGEKIYLGPISIPTALLALIPLKVQGNPQQIDMARRTGSMNAEIRASSAQLQGIKEEAKRIHDRVERERAQRAKDKAAAAANGGTPPPER